MLNPPPPTPQQRIRIIGQSHSSTFFQLPYLKARSRRSGIGTSGPASKRSGVGGGALFNHLAAPRKSDTCICSFSEINLHLFSSIFHQLQLKRLLNYRSESLGMLTIQ